MIQSMSWLLLLVVVTLDGATCTAPYYSSFGSIYPYQSSVIPSVYSPSLLDTSYSAVVPSSVHHHHHHHHYYGKSPYSYGGSTSDGTLPSTTGQSTVFSSSWPAHSYSSTVFSGSKYPSSFGSSGSWFYPSLLTSYHQILKTTVDNSTTTEDGQVKVGNKTEHVFKNTLGKWPYAYQPFWIYQGSIQHFPAKKDGDTTTAESSTAGSSDGDKMEKDESQSSEESSTTDDKEEEDEENNDKEATTASPEKAAKLKKRLNKSSNNKRNKKSTKDNKKNKTDKKK